MTKGKQGFASMHPNRVRFIASQGGRAQGKDNNPGNFARDPEKARRAGRIGGKKSRRGPVEES
jgi:general stress protein YciG